MSFAFDVLLLFQKSESASFIKVFLVYASSGGSLVLYSCSSLVGIFGYLFGLFRCIGYR